MLIVCGLSVVSLLPSADSVNRKHRIAVRFAFGSDVQLSQDVLPLTVGGRYINKARGGGDYVTGQISFRLTSRLSVLGRAETSSVYGGSTALLFDDNWAQGGQREVYALNDYPNYYVGNAVSNYTNNYSYRRNLMIGLGFNIVQLRHWWVRLSVLGGTNVVRGLPQALLLKEKGSNYYQTVEYLPQQRRGWSANAELSLGYKLRVGKKYEAGFSFDHALTWNQIPVTYLIQSTDILGRINQKTTDEVFALCLRRVGFGFQFWF